MVILAGAWKELGVCAGEAVYFVEREGTEVVRVVDGNH
jgi:hypothetical protein